MRRILFLLLLCWGLGASALEILEPRNPAVRGDWFYLSGDGLRAARISSGETRWTVLVDKHLFAPTVSGDRIFVGSSDGLFAVNRRSGRVLWRRSAGQTIFSPLVVEDRLYAGGLSGDVIAWSKEGKVLWRARLPGWVYSPVWNRGLLITGGSDQTLWALAPETGEVRWRAPLDQELAFRPVAAGGRVVATTFAGTVAQYDARGRTVWRRDDGVATLAPLVAGGHVLLAGLDGSVRIRDFADGALLFRAELRGRIIHRPLQAGERVFLVSEAGEAALFDFARRTWLVQALAADAAGWLPLAAADEFFLVNPRVTRKEMPRTVVFHLGGLRSMGF